MEMGGGLTALAPLLGMIPGIGSALSMGAGLIGSISNQLGADQTASETWNKENKVKGNTPTGTLGLPNYRKGGPLNLGGPGVPESQLLDIGALPTPNVISPEEAEAIRDAQWKSYFKGSPMEEAAKAAGLNKGKTKYVKGPRTEYEKYLEDLKTTSSEYEVDDAMVSPLTSKEFYDDVRASEASNEAYRKKQLEGGEMKQSTVQKIAKLQGSLDQFQNTSEALNSRIPGTKAYDEIFHELNGALTKNEYGYNVPGKMKRKNVAGDYTDNYAPYDWSLQNREQTAGGQGSNEIGLNPVNTGLNVNTNVVGKDLTEDTSPELPAFKYGGKMQYRNGGGILKQYVGPKHEQGGMPVDAMGNPTSNQGNQIAEVEGGETSKDNYVFSDSLHNPNTGNTFADDSKMISKKYKRGIAGDYLKANTKELEFKKLSAKNTKVKEQIEAAKALLAGGQPEQGMPQFNNGGDLFGTDPELTGLSTSPFMQALGFPQSGGPTVPNTAVPLQLPTKYTTGLYSVGATSTNVPAGKTYQSLLQQQARDNMKGSILKDSPLETSMIPAGELAKRNTITAPPEFGVGLSGINTNVTSSVNNVLANNASNTNNVNNANGTPFDISKIVPQVNPLAPKVGTAPGMGVLDPNAKPGDTVEGNAKATLGDKIQAASNFLSPAFNLATSLTGYDREPEVANKYGKEALAIMKNAKVRPDFNPLLGQANATKTAINAGATGPQRMASLLGLNNQTTSALSSAAIQTANQNVALEQQYAQTALGLGEQDRNEAIRAKGTTDANKAQQFNMMSKAFEQIGPAIGTIGSGMNQRQEDLMTYNLMKQIMPNMSLEDFEKFMKSKGNEAVKYVGGVKSFTTGKSQ